MGGISPKRFSLIKHTPQTFSIFCNVKFMPRSISLLLLSYNLTKVNFIHHPPHLISYPPFPISNTHPLVYLPLPPPNLCSISVGLMVAFVDVELVGFLYWAGLSFNSVTSINLLIAVGVTVDYSAFYAFSFMTKVGTRAERAEEALRQFGVAVFNGGFTLFLAILPLALSQSYIFITFFKVISPISKLSL